MNKVCILQLDTKFPRIPGDVACPQTFIRDVRIVEIKKAYVNNVVRGTPENSQLIKFEKKYIWKCIHMCIQDDRNTCVIRGVLSKVQVPSYLDDLRILNVFRKWYNTCVFDTYSKATRYTRKQRVSRAHVFAKY